MLRLVISFSVVLFLAASPDGHAAKDGKATISPAGQVAKAKNNNARGVAHGKSNRVSPARNITRDKLPEPVRGGTPIVEYRSFDGSGNNLLSPLIGAAGTQLNRWCPAEYEDGMAAMSGSSQNSARMISNLVADQPALLPNAGRVSDYLWLWGQFLDHDIDLTDGADPAEPAAIMVPLGDDWFDPDDTGTQTIAFNRSIYDHATGTVPGNPRQQLNEISTWIDASNVYGSNATRADALRVNDGSGKLLVSTGNLLPFNTAGFPNAGGPSPDLFFAGDVRANEQAGLTAMHTLFVREHNRLADEIATGQPALSGDEIYQRARQIVGAQMQVITYNEFLPLFIGADALPAYGGYQPGLNPSIANIFSSALYRMGHSLLSPELMRLDGNGDEVAEGHLSLRDAFFNPTPLTDEGGIEPLLRGFASQVSQTVDVFVIDDVRNFLFGQPGQGGFDLASLNIQRGRDHGLPRYNKARNQLGLSPKTSFADVSSDPEVQARLALAYASVNDLDVWVGGLAEDHAPGAMVGELIRTVAITQFGLLRDADRFWYENIFDPTTIQELESTTLADIIRRNTTIDSEIQDNVFVVPQVIDSDDDGIPDASDNCPSVANASQCDSDDDGFGNMCDGDLNNSGSLTGFDDLALFSQAFGSVSSAPDFDPADFDCSGGTIGFTDLGRFAELFGTAPGGDTP